MRIRLRGGPKVFFPPGTRLAVEADGSWSLLDAQSHPYARMPAGGYYFGFVRLTMAARRIDPRAFRPADTVPEKTGGLREKTRIWIEYELARPDQVKTAVYNAPGQLLELLDQGLQAAGTYWVTWAADGRATGTSFYQVSTRTARQLRKMLLLQ